MKKTSAIVFIGLLLLPAIFTACSTTGDRERRLQQTAKILEEIRNYEPSASASNDQKVSPQKGDTIESPEHHVTTSPQTQEGAVDQQGDAVDQTPKRSALVASEATSLPDRLKLKRGRPQPDETIELMWMVPREEEGVIKYHILYGTSFENLDQRSVIPVKELKVQRDPVFGDVYIFRLEGVTTNKTVFVSIAAENAGGVSRASQTFKIKPGQRHGSPITGDLGSN